MNHDANAQGKSSHIELRSSKIEKMELQKCTISIGDDVELYDHPEITDLSIEADNSKASFILDQSVVEHLEDKEFKQVHQLNEELRKIMKAGPDYKLQPETRILLRNLTDNIV